MKIIFNYLSKNVTAKERYKEKYEGWLVQNRTKNIIGTAIWYSNILSYSTTCGNLQKEIKVGFRLTGGLMETESSCFRA